MALSFLPGAPSELKPRITVIGVGGAGGNAVNNMIASKLEGVEFIVANTDAQALGQARTENRIQLGVGATQGLGAGSRPDVGRMAAEESIEELTNLLAGCNMVFITAGMGGGTGTGAAPVIARAARDMGILTVGVVTKPFHFEGAHRMRTAESGIEELAQFVDTLIIIPNQNLFRLATERTTFADAFKMADDVLHSGVRGVTDLMVMPGLINLDFADIRTVMSEMGKAMMGTGEAGGEKRAIEAAEAAISNPLLDDTSMKGARGVLINITGGADMTLFEVDEAANRIRDEVDSEANIIFGSTFDEKLNGVMRVSVVATGIQSEAAAAPRPTTVIQLPTAAQQPRPQVAPGAMPAAQPRPAQPAMAMQRPAMAPIPPRPAIQNERPATMAEQRPMARPAVQAAAQLSQEEREPEIDFHSDPGVRMEPSFTRAPARPEMNEQPDMEAMSRAVTGITNAPQQQQPQQQQQQYFAEEPRRNGSILGRMLPDRWTKGSQRAEAAPAPAPAPQPRMGAVETRHEPTGPRQSDDLDIPAFLRRQAN